MALVSQFRQLQVRAFMKTTNSKTTVVVGAIRAPGDSVVTTLAVTLQTS